MTIATHMRQKYKSRPYGDGLFNRHPPGGQDVLLLCNVVDELERMLIGALPLLPDRKHIEVKHWLLVMEGRK